MTAQLKLVDYNSLTHADFVAALASVWEDAAWVTEAIAHQRPFFSASELHEAMFSQVTSLPLEKLLAFLNRHPELGGSALKTGQITSESKAEQQSVQLNSLDAAEAVEWTTLNAAYKERFGFPFILCVRRHSRVSALAALRARLGGSRSLELTTALDEVSWITRYRLAARITDHDIAGL